MMPVTIFSRFDGLSGAYCIFGVNYFFSIFNFNVSIGMSLKGMVERSLLFKDEPLTHKIDKVMLV